MKIGAYALATAALSPSIITAAPRLALATAPEYIEAGSFQDPKFSWSPAFEAVKLEDVGAQWPFSIHSQVKTNDENIYTNVLSHLYPTQDELSALWGNAVRFTNATYSNGTKIDLVASIKDYEWDFNWDNTYTDHPNYFVAALSQDNLAGPVPQLDPSTKPGAPLFEWCGYKYIDFELKYVKAGTTTPYPVTGHFSFSDIDWGESFSIDGASQILISKNNDHLTVDGDLITADLKSNEEAGLEKCTVTVILDAVSTFRLKLYNNPWKVALYCLDSSTLVNFTPDAPTKSVKIVG